MTDNRIQWIEKYYPHNVVDLVLSATYKKKLSTIIETRDIQNLIISGPSGIGKSCIASILANNIYGKYYNDAVLKLNLLDDKGIKFIQGDVAGFCKAKIPYNKEDEMVYPKYKLIIFDEADNIIDRAQDQISGMMEKYKDYIRFIFTCNSTSDINESIQTKCLSWLLTYQPLSMITEWLQKICINEKIKYDVSVLEKIVIFSGGDMCIALNKLQNIYNVYTEINEENFNKLCDVPPEQTIKKLFLLVADKNIKESLKMVSYLKKNSFSGLDILDSMFVVLSYPGYKDISEKLKIQFGKIVCDGIFNISSITDSDLQLAGCIIDMVRSV